MTNSFQYCEDLAILNGKRLLFQNYRFHHMGILLEHYKAGSKENRPPHQLFFKL